MKKQKHCGLLLLAAFFIVSCKNKQPGEKDVAVKEIAASEKAFEQMAAEKGLAEAFSFFADSLAVIKRGNDSLIKGKAGIRNFYNAANFLQARVQWSPDFIEASQDGKMGYTYGRYVWTGIDNNGAMVKNSGVFHTVWKKQTDGSWKYVWD